MYFTDTPSLNSVEAIMKRSPGQRQRDGGRKRRSYSYTKKDCDCRFCLYYRKKGGCTLPVCPALDIRLECGAVTLKEVILSAFQDVPHTPFQRRLAKLYKRKDDIPMIFQSETHKRIFEAERTKLRKPDNRALAALYLLTAEHSLWISAKHHIGKDGKVDLQSVRLGNISTDGYALWKAVKELQSAERQISMCELSNNEVISDRAFRLIVQAMTAARFGAAVLTGQEVHHA
mgnify:FL=1